MTHVQAFQLCRWTVPFFGCFKCNVDISVNEEDILSAYGVVVKDADGILVLGISSVFQGIYSPIIAVTLALHKL